MLLAKIRGVLAGHSKELGCGWLPDDNSWLCVLISLDVADKEFRIDGCIRTY